MGERPWCHKHPNRYLPRDGNRCVDCDRELSEERDEGRKESADRIHDLERELAEAKALLADTTQALDESRRVERMRGDLLGDEQKRRVSIERELASSRHDNAALREQVDHWRTEHGMRADEVTKLERELAGVTEIRRIADAQRDEARAKLTRSEERCAKLEAKLLFIADTARAALAPDGGE